MRRTTHIAVRVAPEQVASAAEFYTSVFGLKEEGREEEGVKLVGENFVLWIDPAQEHNVALQEFSTPTAQEKKAEFLARGCTVFGESTYGYHVRDPYGLCFHVWDEANNEPPD